MNAPHPHPSPIRPRFTALLSAILLLSVATSQAAEGEWLTDFAKAKSKAKAENKLILMDFTGSDWCPPCKALHKNVLSQEKFTKFAKDNLVLMEVDFPRSKPQSDDLKKANEALSREYGIEGYPTIILADSTGKTLSKEVGYQGDTPESFILKVQKARKP
jgi:thioredoxin-related protein